VALGDYYCGQKITKKLALINNDTMPLYLSFTKFASDNTEVCCFSPSNTFHQFTKHTHHNHMNRLGFIIVMKLEKKLILKVKILLLTRKVYFPQNPK
jgi:hypothetical protein